MRKLVAILLTMALVLGLASVASAKKPTTLQIYWIGNGDNEEFTPFTNPKITTTSEVFYINFNTPDRGNVKLRSGKTLTSGDIYVLTIDTSDTSHVILSTENITTGMEDVSTRRTSHDGVFYDITGKKIGGIAPRHHDRQGQKQIIIVDGKKIVR